MNNLIGISGKIGSGKDTVGKLIMIHDSIKNCDNLKNIDVKEILSKWDDEEWMIHDCSQYKVMKFAYKLKVFISMLTGIPVADLEKSEVKNSKLGEEWAYLLWWNGQNMLRVNPNRYKDFEPHRLKNYTVREMLQYLGTELFRHQLHEDVWVNALFADYVPESERPVITDKGAYINFNSVYPKWIITDVRFPNEAKAIEKRGGVLIRVDNPEHTPSEGEHPSETSLDNYDFKIRIINDKTKGLEVLSKKVEEILLTI